MQVITGKYRAKKLRAPNSKTTRPTLQRAKESMFNMLPHKLNNTMVLDIFAGSGQLGIEALSRGAINCVFNELDLKASKILSYNLRIINKAEYQIYNFDYKKLIAKFKNQKFDLIFIDAPYPIAKESLDYLLSFINQNNMLNKHGFITGQIPQDINLEDKFDNFKLKKTKDFSKITRIWQYEKR